MAEFYLEFEKPILELQQKISEMEKLSVSSKMDCRAELEALKVRLEKMKSEIYSNLTAWQRVQLSRHPDRPYALDYIERVFSNFIELSGDRRFSDDKAIVGGFAKFNDKPVMVIGTQKGRDMKSNMYRNFGWPKPEGYRKAMRLMKLADKAGVPVITLIDTPGAYPGISSEERHIAEAIAVNLRDMFSLRVPVISVIIGEGGSGGAIGLGVGNRLLILENAYYSVITPEGCAAILWKDRKFAPQAADALQLTAQKLLALGIADQVVPEPVGGAHRDVHAAAQFLSKALAKELASLSKLSGTRLKNQRYDKFRAMGQFEELAATAATPAAEEAQA